MSDYKVAEVEVAVCLSECSEGNGPPPRGGGTGSLWEGGNRGRRRKTSEERGGEGNDVMSNRK